MKSKLILMMIIAGSLLMVGCSSDSPVVEGASVKMKAVTTSSTISSTSGRVKASSLVFDEAMLGVRKLEFKTTLSGDSIDGNGDDDHGGNGEHDDDDNNGSGNGDDDDDSLHMEFKGPFIIDLVKGTSTPDLSTLSIVPGLYKSIEVKAGSVLDDGNSLFVSFRYGSDSVRVELSTKQSFKFEVADSVGFQVDSNTLTNILVLFNLDSLVSNLDLTGVSADADGVIRINDTSNSDIIHAILFNLRHACKAGEDDDHDDEIDHD